MKNTFKFLGIAALMAVIVFSMLSCDTGGGGGKSAKYTAAIFSVSNSVFTSMFTGQTLPGSGEFKILSGDPETLMTQVYTAYFTADMNDDILADDEGISLSQVEKAINQYLVGTYITNQQKTEIMNELKSKDYCVAVVDLGGNEVGIAAAYKE